MESIQNIVIRIGQRDAGLGNGLHQRRGVACTVTASQVAVGRGNVSTASIDGTAEDALQTIIDIGNLTGAAEAELRRAVFVVMREGGGIGSMSSTYLFLDEQNAKERKNEQLPAQSLE